MKLILSRKGFDSSYGGVPSPVLDDGRMWSVPIPLAAGASTAGYSLDELRLSDIVSDLTNGRIGADSTVHADPALHRSAAPRAPGWRPDVGQLQPEHCAPRSETRWVAIRNAMGYTPP